MKSWYIILAELVALGIIIHQARSETTATVTLRLPSGAQALMSPTVVRRSTRKGGTIGAMEYSTNTTRGLY